MRDLVLIVVVAGCCLMAFRRPFFGLLTYVCLGVLNPQSMMWGVGRAAQLSQFAAASTMIGYIASAEPKRIVRERESVLLLILWILFGVTTAFAIYPEQAMDQLTIVSKIFLMIFLTTSLVASEDRLHQLLRVLALSLGFYGLKAGLFVLSTGGNEMVFGPEATFLEANNSIGLALAMNIPLLVYLVKREEHKWLSWVMKAMVVLSYPAVIATYSRGAWVALAIVTLLLLLKERRPLLNLGIAVLLLTLLLPLASQILPQRMLTRYDSLVNYEDDRSAESRFWNWEFCQRVGLANPVTGGGFNFYSPEVYAVYYPEFLEKWGSDRVWSCHSIWFTMLGEHGLPGLIIWLALLGSCFISLRQLRSLGKAHESVSWIRQLADALWIAMIAFMVAGTFVDAVYFDLLYYLIAAIIVLKDRTRLLDLRAVRRPAGPQLLEAQLASQPARVELVTDAH